LIDEIDMK